MFLTIIILVSVSVGIIIGIVENRIFMHFHSNGCLTKVYSEEPDTDPYFMLEITHSDFQKIMKAKYVTFRVRDTHIAPQK